MNITMTLNGKKISADIDADMLLIDFVRDHGCYSVKRGCETSNCGLCTVFLDEKPVLSCSVLAARADGRTVTTLAATGQDVFHEHFWPFTEGFSYARANDFESLLSCVTENTCAVLIELIQGEGGVMPLEKEFVRKTAALCKEKDILLMVDEVQTGIGRTGSLYCYEQYGIEPDVITSAKGLGGGLPIGACLCASRLGEVLGAGMHGTTFGGNPVSCAGGLEVLQRVAKDGFLRSVEEKGRYLREKLSKMTGVQELRGLGMMIGIVLAKDNAKEVAGRCVKNGLLVLTAKTVLRLLPPLNITYEEIDQGLEILEKSILEG